MEATNLRFGRFGLRPSERRLLADGQPVAGNITTQVCGLRKVWGDDGDPAPARQRALKTAATLLAAAERLAFAVDDSAGYAPGTAAEREILPPARRAVRAHCAPLIATASRGRRSACTQRFAARPWPPPCF